MRRLTTQEKLLSMADVAKRLSMSQRWVALQCREGNLKATKMGKKWRVAEQDLEEFVKKGAWLKVG